MKVTPTEATYHIYKQILDMVVRNMQLRPGPMRLTDNEIWILKEAYMTFRKAEHKAYEAERKAHLCR